MSQDVDVLEQRVDNALRAAHRDGPEWLEVKAAVEALKNDRRDRMKAKTSTGETFDHFADAVSREVDQAAKVLEEEASRLGLKAKAFLGDLRGAVDRFRDK